MLVAEDPEGALLVEAGIPEEVCEPVVEDVPETPEVLEAEF